MIQSRVEEYLDRDDVFALHFLHGLILRGVDTADVDPAGLHELLSKWGTQWTRFEKYTNQSAEPPPGPYVLDDGELFEVWRVYDDFNRAFILSTWQLEENKR